MWKIVKMLKYPFLNGTLLPFKIYTEAGILIRKNAIIQMKGRLTIGNPNAKGACVSRQKANLYVGYNSGLELEESVSIGPGVTIIVKDKAQLKIGRNTYFTSDMHLEAVNKISIGNNCAISWGVTIIDDDHHQVVPGSKKSVLKEVTIGDRVWIGCNVTILKGTKIGDNCIVSAGSIVKGEFPSNVLIAGNPARIIKEGVSWK